MLNYALAILLTITSYYPNEESIQNKFDSLILESRNLYSNDQIHEAKQKANEAYSFAKKYNYEKGKAKALFVKAFLVQKNEEYEKAIPYYLELIQRFKDLNNKEAYQDMCKVYLNLGNIMYDHSKYNKAIMYYNQGIQIALDWNLPDQYNNLMNNKINNYIDQKDYQSASIFLSERMLSKAGFDNLEKRLESLNQNGLIFNGQKLYEKARIKYKEIIESEKNAPTSTFSGTALINIASSHYDEGNYEIALNFYDKAIKLSSAHNEVADMYLINLSYSKVYLANGNLEKAITHAKKAETIFPEINLSKENVEIFSLLSDINFEMGDIEAGKKYAKIHASKLSELIDRQQKITEIGNQYKMDYITTSYFSEKEKRRNTNTFIWVIVTMILSFLAFRLYQLYKKIMVGRLLRKEMAAVDFDLDDHL